MRFIEHFNDMFKSRYAALVCDWDAEDHKTGVNNHANLHGAPTRYSHLFDVPVNHTRSTEL